jgi:ribosome-binding factor A
MPSVRQAKVAEMIKRELAEIFQREMRDPRLALASVTDVEVARDFTAAKVFVSVIGDEKEKAEALRALQGASGFLRGQLGRAIDLRTVPALSFRYDTGIERGVRMFELLRQEEEELAAAAAAADGADGHGGAAPPAGEAAAGAADEQGDDDAAGGGAAPQERAEAAP